MINLFYYDRETFAIDLIAKNFKIIFQKAYKKEKILFLDILKSDESSLLKYVNDICNVEEPAENVLKHVSSNYLHNSDSFDKYYIVNMYYRLPAVEKLSKYLASLILKMHISHNKYVQDGITYNISSVIRYFVHLVEILNILHKESRIELSIEELLNKISNDQLIIIEPIDKRKYDYSCKIDNIVYSISSHYVVKNLNLKSDMTALKYFFNNAKKIIKKEPISYIDTTKKNKRYIEDDYFITKAKKDSNPINLENRIEEDNALKENIQIKIANKKNTQSLQNKRIMAISASITKSKLQLPSLYKVPSVGVLSRFCKFIIEKLEDKNQKESEKNAYTVSVFIVSIIMGIHPSKAVKLFFSKTKYDVDNNTVELEINTEHFAKYEQFDEKLGIQTTNKISYKIPFEFIHLIEKIREYNIKSYDEKDFQKRMRLFAKKFDKIININFNNIFNSSLIHRKLIYSNVNTEILLASQNIDQNLTSTLAYTAMPVNALEYSNWINEYLELLGLKVVLQKYLFSKSISQSILFEFGKETELVGSRKLIKKEAFIDFLKQIESLLKERRLDKATRFNIYSIYTRYTLSLLLGIRDFGISIELNRISWNNNVIFIKEKGKYKNSGYRMVPLTRLTKQILQNYLRVLSTLNISENNVVLIDLKSQKVLPTTISNIKKVFKQFNFYKKHQILYQSLKAIPLNLGRHLIVSMVTVAGVSRDDLNAFMGHSVDGGESLGMYSMHDPVAYRKKFELIIDEITEMYKLKDIYHATRL